MSKREKRRFLPDMQFITACISTTMVLMLLGVVAFVLLSARSLSIYVRENISFSVLLSDEMRETDILKFQRKLETEPFVKSTTYISKEQALREETEAMGTDPLEFVGYNPFTASIEINLNSDYANKDSIPWIEKKVAGMAKVTEIVYPGDLVDAVNSNVHKVSFVLLALATLLTVISFALINNTIRLTIYAKRFAIHTMKLVGADWSFIRRPFLVRNFWIGIISALLADGFLMLGGYWLVKYEPDLIHVVTTDTMLAIMCIVSLFGVLITLMSAFISVNRYLRMKAGTLYYI